MWFGYVFVFNNAACEQDEKTSPQLLIDLHQGSAYIQEQKKKVNRQNCVQWKYKQWRVLFL